MRPYMRPEDADTYTRERVRESAHVPSIVAGHIWDI